MDVIIVCHTEYGSVSGKTISWNQDPAGVDRGVPNLVSVAERVGARVTFAVMPEVVSHFIPAPGHEVALHIHAGWEPFTNNGKTEHMGDRYLWEHCDQKEISSALIDHSLDEQRELIRTGGDLLEDRFGQKPTTFVAGQWSLNNDTIKALIEYGITRDCSAPAGHPPYHHDWSRLPRICMPYHPSEQDYQEQGDLPILLIPISQTLLFGSVNPENLPTFGIRWLKACFQEYYSQGAPLFHICLHSPSMTDPAFINGMNDLLAFIASHQDIHFRTASEISKYPDSESHTRLIPYLFGINNTLMKTCMRTVLSKI